MKRYSYYSRLLHLELQIHGLLYCLQVLVDSGACCNRIDVEGSSPLVYAIKADNPDSVIRLLDNGANPDGSAWNDTIKSTYTSCPLFIVMKDDDLTMLRILLKYNCSLNIMTALKDGHDLVGPLEYCLHQRHIIAAKMLLTAGANHWLISPEVLEDIVLWLLEENSDTCLWIAQEMKKPPSLIQRCRLTIRNVLGCRVGWALHTLPLPTRLINFLNLNELDIY